MRPALPLCLFTALLCAGCGANSYTVPGGAADFEKLGLTPEAKAALTDHSVQKILDKKPMLTFNATIAIARVQARDYDSYSYSRFRPTVTPEGAYSVITVRDIEKQEDFDALAHLPKLDGIVPLKRILLNRTLNSDEELRAAAASLHANLLLFYTFDTSFRTDHYVQPLGVITLGMFPTDKPQVTSTASAVLMDVNNGYIYAAVEATAANDQLANAWTSDQAMDEVRRRTERQAFEQLLAQFKGEWPNVVRTYDKPATPSANMR